MQALWCSCARTYTGGAAERVTFSPDAALTQVRETSPIGYNVRNHHAARGYFTLFTLRHAFGPEWRSMAGRHDPDVTHRLAESALVAYIYIILSQTEPRNLKATTIHRE